MVLFTTGPLVTGSSRRSMRRDSSFSGIRPIDSSTVSHVDVAGPAHVGPEGLVHRRDRDAVDPVAAADVDDVVERCSGMS